MYLKSVVVRLDYQSHLTRSLVPVLSSGQRREVGMCPRRSRFFHEVRDHPVLLSRRSTLPVYLFTATGEVVKETPGFEGRTGYLEKSGPTSNFEREVEEGTRPE